MTELQKKGGKGWIDVEFIMDAVEQVIECRRVLKYTYAYAYQLPDGARKTLFEYNQSMLEVNTEKLSELSEMNVDQVDRSKVMNYTKVTAQFLKSLLDEVYKEEMEGFGNATSV
jgi:ariadne-1